MAKINIVGAKTVNQLDIVANNDVKSSKFVAGVDDNVQLKTLNYAMLSGAIYGDISGNFYLKSATSSSIEIETAIENIEEQITANTIKPAKVNQLGGFEVDSSIVEYQNLKEKNYIPLCTGKIIDDQSQSNLSNIGYAIINDDKIDEIITDSTPYLETTRSITTNNSRINIVNQQINELQAQIGNITNMSEDKVYYLTEVNTDMFGTIMRKNYLDLSVNTEDTIAYFSLFDGDKNIFNIISSSGATSDEIRDRISKLTVDISAYKEDNSTKVKFYAYTSTIDTNGESELTAESYPIPLDSNSLSAIHASIGQNTYDLAILYANVPQTTINDIGGSEEAIKFLPDDVWRINALNDDSDLSINLSSAIDFYNAADGSLNGLVWQNINNICSEISVKVDNICSEISVKVDNICSEISTNINNICTDISTALSGLCFYNTTITDLYQALSTKIWRDLSTKFNISALA